MEIANGELKRIHERLTAIEKKQEDADDKRVELTRLIMGDPKMQVEPLRVTVSRIDKVMKRGIYILIGFTLGNAGISFAALLSVIFGGTP